MKLLLIAAMTYGALGANCAASQSASDNVVDAATFYCVTGKGTISGLAKSTSPAVTGTCACTCVAGYKGAGCNTANDCTANSGTRTGFTIETAAGTNVAGLGAVSCADGYFGTAVAACAANAGAFGFTGCTACTKPTTPAAWAQVLTVSCTDATAANTWATSCNAGYAYTAAVTAATAVTAVAADTQACPAVTAVTGVTAATASASACATAACAGEQTGCTTGTATNTANTCAAGGKLKCTGTANNYRLDGTTGNVVACGTGSDDANAATWAAAASPWTACTPATCNAGWKLVSGACVANTCTAAAVPAGYTAGGTPAVVAVTAVTRACPSTCADTPPTGTCTAGVTAVTAADAVLASTKTTVAGLGVLGCATGYTGTAVAACATDAGAFAYTGCAQGTAPASVAQTMIAFVLTVVAMYL